ncbi:class I SAM-dependent methyltransferase [Catenovulum sediminis]
MPDPNTSIISTETNNLYINALAERFSLSVNNHSNHEFQLIWQEGSLRLIQTSLPKQGAIWVDFTGASAVYRRQQVSIKSEVIARAVGIKANYRPSVLDATAGLGRDGFVLASMGCQVCYLERHPVVAALLFDGIQRALRDAEIGDWAKQHLDFMHGNSADVGWLAAHIKHQPDVVYLDPMFPHKKKSAAVKKEMKSFQSLVGADSDADNLLPAALTIAKQRVVVKRPDYAGFLNQQAPDVSLKSKKHRFDVYLIQN